eukprot:SAG31_NODE_5105_length_2741_cov_1.134746_2_plen_79_part_00
MRPKCPTTCCGRLTVGFIAQVLAEGGPTAVGWGNIAVGCGSYDLALLFTVHCPNNLLLTCAQEVVHMLAHHLSHCCLI